MEKFPLIIEHETTLHPVIIAPSAKVFASNTLICCLKLIGINLLAFGLELCACAGFTYVPPILLKSGFSEKNLTVIMGFGPLISFLLVPVISRWSDKCQSRFGRRRPFMLALGLLMICSLLIIPFSNDIFSEQSYILHPKFVLAAGVILLDFSSQALMNPCKSLIPDIFHSSEEQTSGFTAYSCMLSFGGCVGYFITSFDWTGTTLGTIFGGQEKAVFSLLAVVLVFLLGINLSIAKEQPIEKGTQLKYNLSNENGHELISVASTVPVNSFTSSHNYHETKRYFLQCLKIRSSLTFIKSLCKTLFFFILLPLSTVTKYNFQELLTMPKVLRNLFLACLFGWMGIMCHDMYYSDFVGQVIYKGKPFEESESTAVNLYDDGVGMASWGLLFHSLSAALYAAFLQPKLIHHFGMRKMYLFGMLAFSLSMFGTVLTKNLILVNSFAAISGIGLAAITTIPCSLVTEYSRRKEFENSCRGVGEELAIIDSAFYLSQIIPSLFLGYVVNYTKSSSTYMFVAALCGAVAYTVAHFVSYTSQLRNVH